MLKCSKEAFAACPDRKCCGCLEEATFTEDSECDMFNRQIGSHTMTHADQIRAMSDEELVKLLCGGVKGFDCQSCRIGDQRKCDMECEDHCKIWLQQPAEVSGDA